MEGSAAVLNECMLKSIGYSFSISIVPCHWALRETTLRSRTLNQCHDRQHPAVPRVACNASRRRPTALKRAQKSFCGLDVRFGMPVSALQPSSALSVILLGSCHQTSPTQPAKDITLQCDKLSHAESKSPLLKEGFRKFTVRRAKCDSPALACKVAGGS